MSKHGLRHLPADPRAALSLPYWAHEDDEEPWPGLDFNREIVQPGANETFPDGAVGIRIDDDFWQVAALPLTWATIPLPEIVRALWPSRAERATFEPDSGESP